MTVPEVIARLENTIMGKEAMLVTLKNVAKHSTTAEGIAADVMVQMLELNLQELNAIQADLLSIKS